MGVIQTRVFKDGNSAAVRLPAALGFAPGTLVDIEKRGNALAISPACDPDEANRNLRRMIADIEQIWADAGGAPDHPAERDPFEAPDRTGL